MWRFKKQRRCCWDLIWKFRVWLTFVYDNCVVISVILVKMSKYSDFHLIIFQKKMHDKILQLSQNWQKHFKSLYGFGGRFLKIRDVCMNFEPYFKVHNLVSVYPKSIILGQMTNLNMSFHVVVSVYRLVKIWNSPQFPDKFWKSYWHDL